MKTDSDSRRTARPAAIIIGLILICASILFFFLSYSSSEIASSLRKVKPGMSIEDAEKKLGMIPYRVIKDSGRSYHAFNLFPDVEAKIGGKGAKLSSYLVEKPMNRALLTECNSVLQVVQARLITSNRVYFPSPYVRNTGQLPLPHQFLNRRFHRFGPHLKALFVRMHGIADQFLV